MCSLVLRSIGWMFPHPYLLSARCSLSSVFPSAVFPQSYVLKVKCFLNPLFPRNVQMDLILPLFKLAVARNALYLFDFNRFSRRWGTKVVFFFF